VRKEAGEAFARKIGCFFFETSAKERINVDESFTTLIRELLRTKGKEGADDDDIFSSAKKDDARARAKSDPVAKGKGLWRSESLKNLKEKMRRKKANKVTHEEEDSDGSDASDGEGNSKDTHHKKKKAPRSRSLRTVRDRVNGHNHHDEDNGKRERCVIS